MVLSLAHLFSHVANWSTRKQEIQVVCVHLRVVPDPAVITIMFWFTAFFFCLYLFGDVKQSGSGERAPGATVDGWKPSLHHLRLSVEVIMLSAHMICIKMIFTEQTKRNRKKKKKDI